MRSRIQSSRLREIFHRFCAMVKKNRHAKPPASCFKALLFLAVLMVMKTSYAAPMLGSHAMMFYNCNGTGDISTPAVTTQTTGSTILAWVGRGTLNAFTPPTDNKTNVYSLLGQIHQYTVWPNSGQALYACLSAAGGTNHMVTAAMPAPDEITVAMIEVRNGGVIQDLQWNEITNVSPSQTSLNVTTSGPATLIAIWTGDAATNVTAVPNNGFTVLDSELLGTCAFEAVVAAKDVPDAGTYNVTWNVTPSQGAQIILVAVQSLPPPFLQAQLAGTNVIVSWRDSAIDYELEMTADLSTTSLWAPVTNVPAVVESQLTVTNAIASGCRFYRLKKL